MTPKLLIGNALLIVLTIVLFVTEEQWQTSLFCLILFNLWQRFGSKEIAELMGDWYALIFWIWTVTIIPYALLTEVFEYPHIRALSVSLLIFVMIVLYLLEKRLRIKEKNRTAFDKLISTIFSNTLIPVNYVYIMRFICLIIIFVLLTPFIFI